MSKRNGGNGQGNGGGFRGVARGGRMKDAGKVRLLVRGIVEGWLTDERMKTAVNALHEIANSDTPDTRARVAAAKGLIEVAKLAQGVAEYDDHTDRVDTGKLTEVVGYAPMVLDGGRDL